MIHRIFCVLLISLFAVSVHAQVEPYDLTVEYMTEPVGIDETAPRLNWKSRATEPGLKNVMQSAYRILVASTPEILAENRGDLWDSGKVESDQSLNIEYAGAPLETSQRCHWKVEVWYKTPDAQFSRYSGASRWIMGVMHPEDWKAQWITHQSIEASMPEAKWIWTGETESLDKAPAGTRYYHMGFGASVKWEQLEQATLAITADDRYEIWLNGEKIVETWGHIADWRWVRHYDLVDKLHDKNILGVVVHNDTEGPTGLLARIDMSFCGYDEGAPTGYATTMHYETEPRLWYWASDVKEGWSTLEKCDANDWKPVVEVGEIGCEPWGKLKDAAPIPDPNYGSDPSYAREFHVEKPVKQATLHISGLGFYEAFLNGTKIGNKVLDPAQTRYDKRVLYSTYDLTGELRKGENNLRVDLGYGWFCVRTVSVWNFDIAPWKDVPQMIAQLEIEYEDGSKEYVVSDENWKCVGKPMRDYYNCIRQGEYVLGPKNEKNLKETKPGPVFTVPGPKGKLVAQAIPPSVVVEEIKPVSITRNRYGYLVDFGQNIAGWVRLTMVDQKAQHYRGNGYGTPSRLWVVLQYGERLDKNGMLDQTPIDCFFKQGNPLFIDDYGEEYRAGSFQTDVYRVQNGEPKTQTYEPRFTYHGFRYVQIEGLSKPLTPKNITACVVHNDFKTVGKFECSSELFNKIQAATVLSYKGNFVNGVPTDCPHREKNGWTGDAHLACTQAQYNFDNTACYEKWIYDLMDEQQPDGNLPGIVPTSGWGYAWGNGPAWDSAICIIPWELYQYKGDRRILERAYPAMKKYVDYLTSREKPNGLVDHGLSDWCVAKTQTDAVVTSSGYYALDVSILIEVAAMLGKTDEAEKYIELLQKIQTSYVKTLYKGDGVVANGSQTAQSFPLHCGMFIGQDESTRKQIAGKLVEAVEKADNHLDVGILGAKSLFHTLSQYGRTDLAMKILNQKTAPGYGDWFERGATTLWEDWGDGASRNHVMFGDVSTWFYQTPAGINLGALGFKEFFLSPEYPEGLDWVRAEHDSPYGPIKVDWRRENGKIKLNFTVPVNTTANHDGKEFGSGDYSFEFDVPASE